MSLSVRANKVTFKVDVLDIYVSEELKIALEKIHSKKPEKIVFDMKKVERIPLPLVNPLLRKTCLRAMAGVWQL